ncbi:hypothetical protein CN558_07840 [Bacillus wiedmannii]|uniref:Uncharacterized protein n=1 Tax=Bacillus wiedmannii TaxID=1890302 RepID=A0A2B5K1H3_9BACI|nr:hypothetical protein CN690_10580 [Bacillus wiedmannii]PEL77803.1 hypothetical protein CN609_24345 [Bacillus wiedmannii]PEM30035.1 hypothetical protein CN598_12990 [Bacillus wiedmannii]PEM90281.1 hypothetical protein CN627_06650 [Bacillus wiedmannii]PEO87770.1 hypothetical protein CN558_07840 [Bacillus wiedmannii]
MTSSLLVVLFPVDLIQLQRLEQSVVSRLPTRQKTPLRQEFQRPLVLNEPLPLLVSSSYSS